MTEAERIIVFCSELWGWFDRNKRALPWRDLREEDPDHKAYLILVSEVMLQQTQVSRVIAMYKNFIHDFPHIEDLSKATNRDILIAWRGLGYNNRALRLRDAAREIAQRGGTFPRDQDELQELPGVGHYTAGAIRNFAFGIPTACLDVNIRRILHRFFVGPENPDGTWKKNDADLLRLAEKVLFSALPPSPPALLPPGEGWRAERAGVRVQRDTASWHAALMDFGSIVCTKNNPKWELMTKTMQSVCMSYGKKIARRTVKKKEPGRMMAGRFVPNRIFRGRIVEVLRDARKPLTRSEIGAHAVADWSMGDHRQWLAGILAKLRHDGLLETRRGKYALKR